MHNDKPYVRLSKEDELNIGICYVRFFSPPDTILKSPAACLGSCRRARKQSGSSQYAVCFAFNRSAKFVMHALVCNFQQPLTDF